METRLWDFCQTSVIKPKRAEMKMSVKQAKTVKTPMSNGTINERARSTICTLELRKRQFRDGRVFSPKYNEHELHTGRHYWDLLTPP